MAAAPDIPETAASHHLCRSSLPLSEGRFKSVGNPSTQTVHITVTFKNHVICEKKVYFKTLCGILDTLLNSALRPTGDITLLSKWIPIALVAYSVSRPTLSLPIRTIKPKPNND